MNDECCFVLLCGSSEYTAQYDIILGTVFCWNLGHSKKFRMMDVSILFYCMGSGKYGHVMD